MFLLLWIKAVARHWWALMSCAIFTLIGVYSAYANMSNDWVVRTTLSAAVLCLFIGCFLAWRDEHEMLSSEQAKNQKPFLEGQIVEAFIGPVITAEVALLSGSSVVLFSVKTWNTVQMPDVVVLNYRLKLTVKTSTGQQVLSGTQDGWQVTLYPESENESIVLLDIARNQLRPQRYAFPQRDYIGFFVPGLFADTKEFNSVEIILVDALNGEHRLCATSLPCTARLKGMPTHKGLAELQN
jgi:hypothetical protein